MHAGRAASLRADLQAVAPLCQLTVRQILHQRPGQAVLGAGRASHPPSEAALTSGKGSGKRREDRVGVGRVTAAGSRAEGRGRGARPLAANLQHQLLQEAVTTAQSPGHLPPGQCR